MLLLIGPTYKVDIYAFGLVLWCLHSSTPGVVLYDGYTDQQVMKLVSDGGRPPLSEMVSTHISKVIKASWQQNATDRPEMQAIHAFLKYPGIFNF